MTKKRTEPIRHIGLRIPEPLHQALTAMARREDRSLSNLVVHLLKQAAARKK